jgi:hypothetical protein
VPSTLFEEPYSTVIESKEGILLEQNSNGQWRFPDKTAFLINSESVLFILRRISFISYVHASSLRAK